MYVIHAPPEQKITFLHVIQAPREPTIYFRCMFFQAPDGLLTRRLVRWVIFFKTSLSSTLLMFKSKEANFYCCLQGTHRCRRSWFLKVPLLAGLYKHGKRRFFKETPPAGFYKKSKQVFCLCNFAARRALQKMQAVLSTTIAACSLKVFGVVATAVKTFETLRKRFLGVSFSVFMNWQYFRFFV